MERVLIVHNYYQQSGGEGNVAENEAALLRNHGHSVFFYTRNNTEIAGYGPIQRLVMAFSTLFSFKTYRQVRALISKEKIDIVHVHNTVPLISPSVYYAAWSLHVPVVQTVHNYRFLCPNGLFYRDGHVCRDCVEKGLVCSVRHGCYRGSKVQTMLLALTMGLHRLLGTYRRIEGVICLTGFAAETLSKAFPKERIYIKPNIVDVPSTPLAYQAHGEDYVFFGRLDQQKGVFVLLEAFEKLPQCKLTIIGGGPEQAAMEAYIKTHHMDNVVMKGQLAHDEALEYVKHARAVVLPTQLYEGLPLTLLESFALGTPVFGSKLGNVGAVLSKWGGGFLFDQTDPEALSACIRQHSREALQTASKEGILAAKALCDPEKNYETLMEIYRFAAAGRQGQ